MTATLGYFRWAFLVTIAALVLAFWLGLSATGNVAGGVSFLMIGTVLAVLEISMSFDNAIVNANILKHMEPAWQKRFLTWGIVIAVFGMRIVFPLVIVAVAAHLGPMAAIRLAVHEPLEYARIMDQAHLSIAAFGGTFLMMVSLSYFIDTTKQVDWIGVVECRMRQCASIQGMEIVMVLAVIMAIAWALPDGDSGDFLFAAIAGMLAFTGVELLGSLLDRTEASLKAAAKTGLGAFIYLEVLDASFSFDGVIGAFALTKNLFLIAIGLGIGAVYVRSLTIMLVERQSLARYRYLEHGAFWSILTLSLVMFAQTLTEISELVAGALGAGLIGLALWSSVRYNRRPKRAR